MDFNNLSRVSRALHEEIAPLMGLPWWRIQEIDEAEDAMLTRRRNVWRRSSAPNRRRNDWRRSAAPNRRRNVWRPG